MPRSKSYLVVAAFDFGTTYSGYAYSYRHDPTKVYTNQIWGSGGAYSKLMTLKAPTSVLLDDEGQFHSFGFEAENHFAMLAEEHRHTGWRLFRRFKMLLHNNKTLSRQATVEDLEGNQHPAMEIFVMAIKYLHGHLLKTIELRQAGMSETELQYVITIPAIWDVGSKQFMREAAVKAGIDGDRLDMAYESEVAAIWCTREIADSPLLDLRLTGSKYILIDLGGGTADITVHQRLPNGNVKVIHKASGGPWGGIYVDQKFWGYLEKIFGQKVLKAFQIKHIGDYFDFTREFEAKKRSNDVLSGTVCSMRLPLSLLQIHQAMNSGMISYFMNIIYSWIYGALPLYKDKLRIASSDAKVWFEQVISQLLKHVKELLDEDIMHGVQTIVLVGGFAESGYVQDRLREEFTGVKLIVPEEAGLAVLKGAVLFGHNPGIVTSRVMAHTYGISVKRPFDETKHHVARKVLENGEWKVKNCFYVFVRVNEEITVNHEVSHTFNPTGITAGIIVHRTLSENPEYTTDSDCDLLGTLVIKANGDIPFKDQSLVVTFMFGQTELLVKVKHMLTGDEETLTLDCLQ